MPRPFARPSAVAAACALAAVLTLAPAAGAAAANFAAWKHSGSITLLTTPEGADLPATATETNFPVLLRLDKEGFDFSQARPDGGDLRFATSAGVPLACQIEDWDAANGSACIWLRVPTIKGNERQSIKVYWGNPAATTDKSAPAVFHAANGFVSVLHMGASLTDELGAVTPVDAGTTAAPAIIGLGRHFTKGTGIHCGDHITTFPFGDNPFTSEAWFRAEMAGATILYWGRYATRLNGNTGDGNEVSLNLGAPASLSWGSDGPGGATASDAAAPTMGRWHHVAATYQDGVSSIYVDGKLEGSNTHKAAMSIVKDVVMSIGGMRGNTSYGFTGDIDEVRVSNVARSADWLHLQYENQKPLQTLVGPIIRKGDEFSVSPAAINMLEGGSATVVAKAGGAEKLYWILKQDGVETITAVDRFSLTLPAGRVTKDTALTLQLKAVFPSGTRSKDIPVTIKEDIPEPVVTLKAPAAWNGRDTIEVVPTIANRPAMAAKGAGEVTTAWTVTGGAVIKEVTPDKLILRRSQTSGKITVQATLNNGGADSLATHTIAVTEPAKDPWVQRIPSKDEKPVDHQFFARDDTNEGTLFYNGTLDEPADSVFLKLYANGKLIKSDSRNLPADRSYAFTLKLKPGLVTYKVEFGSKEKSANAEKILHSADNLVCGDAYLIQGQSNAEASGPNNGPAAVDPATPADPWIRSFGNQHTGTPQGGWVNAVRTRTWGQPDYGLGQIGAWGMELARNLVTKHRIPICIINGAYGGTPIFHHQPNPADRFDSSGGFYANPYKIYGSLLTRVTAANLTHGIRGVLWHQGENDQGSGAPTGDHNWRSYQQYFIDMSAAWKQDFPNIQNYYVFQIWPSGCNMGGPVGDMLTEAQRTLPRLYSNMRIMSTLGVKSASSGRGLCHFDMDGYAQLAKLMSPLVEQDHYGLDASRVLSAPNLVRAGLAGPDKTRIVLEFDQPMAWQDECKAWLELDGVAAPVQSGKAAGKLITLELSTPVSAKSIGYVSGRHWDGRQDKLIYGTNGIAALAFCAVPLQAAAP